MSESKTIIRIRAAFNKPRPKMSKTDYIKDKSRVTKKYEYENFWKRAKKVALHVQSRRENEFYEETLLPVRHLSRQNQRYENYKFNKSHASLLQKSPLGPGW